jgi:hypothetical protein
MSTPSTGMEAIQAVGHVLSGLSLLTGGVVSYLALRIKNENAALRTELMGKISEVQIIIAALPGEILKGINGKYISRIEHEEKEKDHDKLHVHLDKEHQKLESSVMEDFDAVDRKISETRARHHALHEEFIACRATHSAGKSR